MNDFATLIDEGNNQLDTASDDAIATMGKKFTEEALEQLSGAAGKLTESLSTTKAKEATQESFDSLTEAIADFQQKVETFQFEAETDFEALNSKIFVWQI